MTVTRIAASTARSDADHTTAPPPACRAIHAGRRRSGHSPNFPPSLQFQLERILSAPYNFLGTPLFWCPSYYSIGPGDSFTGANFLGQRVAASKRAEQAGLAGRCHSARSLGAMGAG